MRLPHKMRLTHKITVRVFYSARAVDCNKKRIRSSPVYITDKLILQNARNNTNFSLILASLRRRVTFQVVTKGRTAARSIGSSPVMQRSIPLASWHRFLPAEHLVLVGYQDQPFSLNHTRRIPSQSWSSFSGFPYLKLISIFFLFLVATISLTTTLANYSDVPEQCQ